LIYFLTYNDPPTGVYRSQVAGVCQYLQSITEEDVKLVSLISIRSYWKNRKKIRSMYVNAMVLPMFPKHKNWRKNRILLNLFLTKKKTATIICRGIFSNQLVRSSGNYKAVVFDGRGAYAAEFNEYLGKGHVNDDIAKLEKEAIQKSDFRLAVSNALVEHWQKEYNYKTNEHVVVPCTLNETEFDLDAQEITNARGKHGFAPTDVVYIYSGSIAGWQSVEMMDTYCSRVLAANENAHFIFLSKFDITKFDAFGKFSNRMKQFWVDPDDVRELLLCGDYGVMIRECTITNKVASPTKFAEYLLAGLKVITTPDLGDYSAMVAEEHVGVIFTEQNPLLILEKLTFEEKKKLNRFAINNFTKSVYELEYRKIIGLNE
jgi:hypothetical protein